MGYSSGAGLAAATPFTGPPKNLLQWFDREVVKRIEISGTRTLGYHQHEVEGDQQAFETLNYSGLGGKRFTDIGSVSLNGRNVAGLVNFQSTVVSNRFADPQQEKSSIDYDRKPFTINIGDIRGSLLNTNRFASFNKFLQGAQARYQYGRFAVKGVVSESRGAAKTLSIQGNNSAGPYYLQTSQVVRGSEEVQVDGVRMELGRDYVVSYELGSITFIGRVIPPTSTIVVSFEALGFNSGFGTVMGVGASYDLGKLGRVGFTQMSQKTGSGDALSTRVELFQGSGPPSVPYFLQFEPLTTRPITVKLDGIPQVLGIDYRFDTSNPTVFFFLRFVPETSTIEVIYTPRPTSTVSGDREVYGFDWTLPIGGQGKSGHISYYQATGQQKSAVSPLKGTARGMDASYRSGPWEFRGYIRDVPSTYVSVETRGLNRNEKAYDWSAKYTGKKFEIDVGHLNSVVALRQTDSDGNLFFRQARTSTFRSAAKYRPELGVTWDLEHTRSTGRNLGTETKLNRTALTTGRTFGRLITRAGMELQDGRGPVLDATGTSTSIENVDLKSFFIEASYTAGDAWSFRGKTGLSDVRTSSRSGMGSDHSLSVGYNPSNRFSLGASYVVSDSGALASLGTFDTGAGLGYGGNGFSGGVGNTNFYTGGTNVRLLLLNSRYVFNERASLVGTYTESKSEGAISSNSQTKAFTFGVELDLGKGHRVHADLAKTHTSFTNSISDIDSTTLNFDLSGSPAGRFSYRLGASMLVTGGNSQFGQDSYYVDGSISYRLAPRQSLSLFGNTGRTSGYLPQDDDQFGIAYAYQIFKNIALVGSYRVRDVRNRSPFETSGAYRSRGFDIELTFNFGL